MELTNTSVYFHRKYVTILFPATTILSAEKTADKIKMSARKYFCFTGEPFLAPYRME